MKDEHRVPELLAVGACGLGVFLLSRMVCEVINANWMMIDYILQIVISFVVAMCFVVIAVVCSNIYKRIKNKLEL
jgi:hypothetical protein